MVKAAQNDIQMKIELLDISKYYGSIHANDGISLIIEPGIHGILGENGAGKSTLMKILSGVTSPTNGSIFIDGISIGYHNPETAAIYGIAMLYQEPSDFGKLSVLENFMLGQNRGLIYRSRYWRERLTSLAEQFGFSLTPTMKVEKLTIGERQQLELLRVLAKGAETLILDEPTTGISSIQKELLFAALQKLAKEGKNVILVSHKLKEVEFLCDRVTVLQKGCVRGEMSKPFDTEMILEMMFKDFPEIPKKNQVIIGEKLIQLEGVSARGGRMGLSDCSAVIRKGEVVGLAGLEGSGQGVFLRLACGIKKSFSGKIKVEEKDLTGRDYHTFKKSGVVFLPANRLEEGLIGNLSIVEHFALLEQSSDLRIAWKEAYHKAMKSIEMFRITGLPESFTTSLSGGNQQRLMLSFLPINSKLLLLENPTRGLDMESTRWVWEYLQSFLDNNSSIVFSSSELDEIILFADRILIFFEGRIIADVPSHEINAEKLGRAIAGKVI